MELGGVSDSRFGWSIVCDNGRDWLNPLLQARGCGAGFERSRASSCKIQDTNIIQSFMTYTYHRYFFYIFFSVRVVSVLRSNSDFSSQPEKPMTPTPKDFYARS